MADIKVQRGTVDVGNTGATDTLTAVSGLSNAFEYNSNNFFTHGGNTASGGNQEGDDMSGTVELTAVDTITLTRQANSLANNMRFDWQVIEYTGSPGGANEFIVRSRNTITMSGGSGSATLDTTPNDIDRCIPFVTGVRTSQTSNNGDELRVAAHINDAGSLIVEKGSSSNTTIVQVVTVEFTGSNWEVYHGTATSSGDTGSITLNTDSDGLGGSPVDVTDWGTALIEAGFTSTDHGLDSIACRYAPGNGQTVNWDFNSGNSSSHKHFVHILQNDDLSVTRFTPSGSNANDTNVNIASAGLTVLDTAMIIGTCQGSGGGTAYGRNWRNYRLTSVINAQHYCHRSGNTINHNIQIIDFENVEDSSGVLLTVNDADHSHSAENTALSHSYSLVLNESGHNHTAESPSLMHGYNLSPSDSLHDHTAEGTTLTHKYNLSTNESLHTHSADSVTLSGSVDLTVNDSVHAHSADSVSLSVNLSPDDTSHLHNAEGAILSHKYNLSANQTNHAHSADNTVLSASYTLSVDETSHSHTADNVTLSFGASLSPNDADHLHTAETTLLSHKYTLAPADAFHNHLADSVLLSSGVSLSVQDSNHTHLSAEVNLTQGYVLTLSDGNHNHSCEGVALSPGFDLTVNDGGHSHTARNVFLSHKYALLTDDAFHEHTAELATVSVSAVLSPQSTNHDHTATEVTFIKDRVDIHTYISKEIDVYTEIGKRPDIHTHISKEIDINTFITKTVNLH